MVEGIVDVTRRAVNKIVALLLKRELSAAANTHPRLPIKKN